MKKKNIIDWIGIVLLILLLLCVVSCDIRSKDDEPMEKIYNIPVYTTVYDIIYPDSAYRYTCTSHIKMRTRSYKGTNYLEVAYVIIGDVISLFGGMMIGKNLILVQLPQYV